MSGFDGVVSEASNIRYGGGTAVTRAEFLSNYPQFVDVSISFMEMILEMANNVIAENRWHSYRKFAVCLYVAHYCTMWMKTNASASSGDEELYNSGSGHGPISSVSVDGLSVSYSNSEATQDLAGFGSLKDTVYGQQLATMSKMVTGGMMIVP